MNQHSSFKEIEQVIRSSKSVLVASHLRPDADALGCTIAMTLWVRSLGISVTAWNEDGMPEKFTYLPEAEIVSSPKPGEREFDLVIALDNSVKARLGKSLEAAGNFKAMVNIDHHISNERYGDWNYVDADSPATGQILFDFFTAIGATITPEMAANLYAAISTDTGSFQYEGTSPHTFEVAAELIRCGVNVSALSKAMYDCQPRRRLDLLRHALNSCEFTSEDRAVCFTLTIAEGLEMGVTAEDNEGIIDHLRAVDSVIIAVFFEELADGKIRVSARSKDPRVDVCKICQQFGGGGHPLAAGARIKGTINEVKALFMAAVHEKLEQLD